MDGDVGHGVDELAALQVAALLELRVAEGPRTHRLGQVRLGQVRSG